MKTATLKGCASALILLLLNFFSVHAQNTCPGVTAQITNAPVINLCTGASATLTAQTAAGYNYQWQRQTSTGGPFANISGATGSSYVANDIGAFRIIVGNGTCADTSTIVNIIRLSLVGGTISRASSAPICPAESGGMLTGSTVPGDDIGIITYQWEKRIGTGVYSPIPGATSLNYTTTPIASTSSFRRSVSDNCGNVAYSNVITITTTPALVAGSIAPSSQSITSGSTPALLTSSANPSGGNGAISHQWQSGPAENGPWTTISGASGLTYQPGALTQTTYFRRVSTDAVCGSTVPTEAIVVIVTNTPLNPGTIASVSSCFFAGFAPALLTTQVPPTGGTPPYAVQWESRTAAGTFSPIAGATGASYQPGVLTQTTIFRKKVTDGAGTALYTNEITITLLSTPLTGGTIGSEATVACIGSSPAKLVSITSASGYGEKLTYKWEMRIGAGAWTTIEGATMGDYQPEPINQQTTFRRVTIDGCGVNTREANSNEITFEVKPALLAGDIRPSSQMIFSGATPALLRSFQDPSGGTNSYTISWQQAALAVGPFTTISGATGLTYQPPALNATTYFRRVVKDNNCLATKYSYVVEVYVTANAPLKGGKLVGSTCVFPGNRPAKISTAFNFPVEGGVPPYSFQWEERAGTAGAFSPIAGATSEQFQPNVITQTMQYRRGVTDAIGQQAYSDTITIELITTALQPGAIAATNTTACAGTAPGTIRSLTAGSNFGEGAHYQWQQSADGINWTNIPGATFGYYTPGALTQTTYFRRAFADQCSGVERKVYSNTVVIKVTPPAPLMGGLITACPAVACYGTAPGTITSLLDACGGCNKMYQWQKNDGSGWTVIPGANSASYSPTAITTATKYRRHTTDGLAGSAYSNEIEIIVYPPIVAGTIGQETQTVCANVVPSKISLITDCHYTNGGVTYQWQVSNSPAGLWTDIVGATSMEYTPTAEAKSKYYRLKVMSTTCSATAYTNVATVIVEQCRVTQIPDESRIRIYPNPNAAGRTLHVEGDIYEGSGFELFSIEGARVDFQVVSRAPNMIRIKLPFNVASGTYLLRINNKGKQQIERIIVAN